MALRSLRERTIQTLSYEAGGFLLAMPLYALIVGHDASSSTLVVVAVAIACGIWSPIHNTAFDWVEWRITGRVASDRPHRMRFLHAASHEVTSIVVTTPIIMIAGGHSFLHALMVDIGLTLLYSAYAYFFHIIYDWMRPVKTLRRWKPARRAPRMARGAQSNRRPSSRSDSGLPPPYMMSVVAPEAVKKRSGSTWRE